MIIQLPFPNYLKDEQHWNQVDYIFSSKDEKAVLHEEKQDLIPIVAQIMGSFLQNYNLNERKPNKQKNKI